MNERELFVAALQFDDPAERLAYLEDVCAGNTELRKRMDVLLAALDDAQSYLEQPVVNVAATAAIAPQSHAGEQVGPYKLLQIVGEGGMGTVWMAEQHIPVRRRVALKLIKPGMDSRQILARFGAERQALSMMDHPNIARVLDAGTTEAGSPYFVMELVKGQPITEYCDRNHLSLRDRLELFLPVCHAIQHAHQKGIIHRDIKPSNVLVAEYDGRPVAKVIDFGVAKAVHQPLIEKTMFTGLGQIIGTLEYMSPEQARVNQLDVDTRSDVYSMGVVLYELLTGSPPLDRKRMREAALDELLRIVREEEAPRPSIKLNTSETLPSIAANRKIEPRRLPMLVRGELDWIVMKALEKDRNRRYETANGLAADIQRYLGDEPVLACPPTARYRLQKFVRKNRAALSVAAMLLIALTMGLIGTTWQAMIANKARLDAVAAKELENTERIKAEQQRDRASRAEATARRSAAAALQAEVREKEQRTVAEEAKKLADEQEILARKNLYAAHMNLAQAAIDETQLPRALELLQRHIPLPGEPDWRSFEWYYMLGQCNRDILTFPRQRMCAPQFTPDDKSVYELIPGKGLQQWDLASRKPVRLLADPTLDYPYAISPDGKLIAAVSGNAIRLFDADAGSLLRTVGSYEHQVTVLEFTSDSTRLVAAFGGYLDNKNIAGRVRIWEIETGNLIHELDGRSHYIDSIGISPDGLRLVAAGNSELSAWRLDTGEVDPLAHSPIKVDRSIAWSPRGDEIVTASNSGRTTSFWDAKTGQHLRDMPAPRHGVFAYNGSGDRLVTSQAGGVLLWDVSSGQSLGSFKGHKQELYDASISPSGRYLGSWARDGTGKIWDTKTVERIEHFESRGPDWGSALNHQYRDPGRDRFAMSNDGSLLAGLADLGMTVKIVQFPSEELVESFKIGSQVNSLVFSPDDRRLLVAHESGFQLWDVQRGKLLIDRAGENAIWAAAVSLDGKYWAVGSNVGKVEVLDAELTRIVELPWKYRTSLLKIRFSPDCRRMAVGTMAWAGENAVIQLWDVTTWQCISSSEFPHVSFADLAFSPNGSLLIACAGQQLRGQDGARSYVVDGHTGAFVRELRSLGEHHMAVAFPSSSDVVAISNEQGQITIWDLRTWEERWNGKFQRHANSSIYNPSLESMRFSPDNQHLVMSDSICRVYVESAAPTTVVESFEREADSFRRLQAYAEKRQWPQLIESVSHLIANGPESAELLCARGGAFAEVTNWDSACTDLQRAVELSPTVFHTWYELAIAQLAAGKYADYRSTSREMLDRFSESQVDSTNSLLFWTVLLNPAPDSDWGNLLAKVAQRFYIGEETAENCRILGALLLAANLPSDAIYVLEQARSATVQDRHRNAADLVDWLLATAYAKANDIKSAELAIARAAEISNPSLVTNEDAWNRRATREFLRSRAETELEKARAFGLLPRNQLTTEQLAHSARIISKAIESNPQIAILYQLRGRSLRQLGKLDEAASDEKRLAAITSEHELRRLNSLATPHRTDHTKFIVERARYLLEHQRNLDQALKDCYFVCSTKEAQVPQVWDLLIEIHAAMNTLEQADSLWPPRLGPRPPDAFYASRIKYYREHGMGEKADADLVKIPSLAITYYLAQEAAAASRSDWTASQTAFRQLLVIQENNPSIPAIAGIAERLASRIQSGGWKPVPLDLVRSFIAETTGINSFSNGQLFTSDTHRSLFQLGDTLLDEPATAQDGRGLILSIVKEFEKIAKREQNPSFSYARAANMMKVVAEHETQPGDRQRFISEAERLAGLAHTSVEPDMVHNMAWWARGEIRRIQGRNEEAQADFLEALTDDYYIWTARGLLLVDAALTLPPGVRAIEHAKETLNRHGDHPAVQHAFGLFLERLVLEKNWKSAGELYRQLLERESENVIWQTNVALCELAVGDKSEFETACQQLVRQLKRFDITQNDRLLLLGTVQCATTIDTSSIAADEILNHPLELGSLESTRLFLKATLALQRGDAKAALERLGGVTSTNFVNPHFPSAIAHLQLGDSRKAREALDRGIDLQNSRSGSDTFKDWRCVVIEDWYRERATEALNVASDQDK